MEKSVSAFTELKRLCKQTELCLACRARAYCDGHMNVRISDAEELDRLVTEWSRLHPRKTLWGHLFDVLPDVKHSEVTFIPDHCPEVYFGDKYANPECAKNCRECWNRLWEG